MKEHDKNYATHYLELAAMVHALKMRRHYLMGKKFELGTNHDGLKYLFEQPILNLRERRWMDEKLCECEFDIKHIKGEENKVTDALSRKLQVIQVTTINTWTLDIRNRIKGACSTYEQYKQVKDNLQQQKVPQKFDKCKIRDDWILL